MHAAGSKAKSDALHPTLPSLQAKLQQPGLVWSEAAAAKIESGKKEWCSTTVSNSTFPPATALSQTGTSEHMCTAFFIRHSSICPFQLYKLFSSPHAA
jgi:hypothetical protein